LAAGTPGRIIDHLERGSIKLNNITHLVLDEADEMLNMGFIDDVEKILECSNKERTMLLFSATMPARLKSIADRHMKGKKKVISIEKKQLTTNLTDQIYFEVSAADKFEALTRIIDVEKDFYALIFCRTKIDVELITRKLNERGYDSEMLHGDVSQALREKTLTRFRQKKINILVATDVAARGIDVNDLTHVINFSLPQDPEAYVHRIGRTGRAGKEGTAITFITTEEYRKLLFIKKIVNAEIRKEKLPKIGDIIQIKTARLKDDIQSIIEGEGHKAYLNIATKLLAENSPEVVLAALLRHSMQMELDERSYSEIREVSIDRKGKTRLFVAFGKLDSITPKKLVTFIKQHVKINEKDIRDIQIFDKFSFITVSFTDAELILNQFKKTKFGKKPVITRAKAK
jgi:ATP-dependent RNA helicase DeaD